MSRDSVWIIELSIVAFALLIGTATAGGMIFAAIQ